MLKDELRTEDAIGKYLESCKNKMQEYENIIIWGAARGGHKLCQYIEACNIRKKLVFADNDCKKAR